MSNKKKGQLSKYCRIFQWVEVQDADFAEAIRDLCLEGALSPAPHAAGVTFLYPDDKAERAKITKMAYEENGADQAARIIESLIIPDVIRKAEEFLRHPVGNRLGELYEAKVESGKTLVGGAEVRPVTDFSTLAARGERLAIWRVSGKLPVSAVGKVYKAPRRSVKGGGPADEAPAAPKVRESIARTVEIQFAANVNRGQRGAYLVSVLGLLNYLKADHNSIFQAVLPVLDYDPLVSFYLLLEPYKTKGNDFLIPDDVISAWHGSMVYTDPVKEYEGLFEEVTGDCQSIARERSGLVMNIETATPSNIGNLVNEHYKTLIASGKISGLDDVLSADCRARLSAEKKRWQDEFRFCIGMATIRLLAGSDCDLEKFENLIVNIRVIWSGNSHKSYLDGQLASAPNRSTLHSELIVFIRSTDFLYVACTPQTVGELTGDQPPESGETYNRNAIAHRRLTKMIVPSQPAGLAPDVISAMRTFKALRGQLPQL